MSCGTGKHTYYGLVALDNYILLQEMHCLVALDDYGGRTLTSHYDIVAFIAVTHCMFSCAVSGIPHTTLRPSWFGCR